MNVLKSVLLGIFTILIGVAIWVSTSSKDGISMVSNGTTIMKGVITSEKENFFKDQRVKDIFLKNNIDIQVNRMTSDKIIKATTTSDFDSYSDFIFPSSITVSEKVRTNFKGSQTYNVFYSPMIVATWTPIIDILKANNLIKTNGNYNNLNMEGFQKTVEAGIRWKDLKQSEQYPVNKVVLISSSDTRFSGSAKMFAALNSYVLNNHNVVSNSTEIDKIMPELKQIIQAQGHRENSSANMTSDYISIGRGKVPMMFTYESEFLNIAFQNKGLFKKDMKIVYPSPTIFSKHVMVIINPKAQIVADLLKNNEDLKKIAVEYGFRIDGDNQIVQKAKSFGIDIPEDVIDVIDPPNYDILDSITELAEQK